MAVLAVLGVVLGAWSMLLLVQRTFFGPLREGKEPVPPDLSLRECLALSPVAAMIVWIGIQPHFFLSRMAPSLDRVTSVVETELDRPAGSQPTRLAHRGACLRGGDVDE